MDDLGVPPWLRTPPFWFTPDPNSSGSPAIGAGVTCVFAEFLSKAQARCGDVGRDLFSAGKDECHCQWVIESIVPSLSFHSLESCVSDVTHTYRCEIYIWLVVGPALRKIWVNWDGDSNPILMGKCQIHGNPLPPTRYSCLSQSSSLQVAAWRKSLWFFRSYLVIVFLCHTRWCPSSWTPTWLIFVQYLGLIRWIYRTS